MKTVEAPADTRMMGIVHEALKRDLLRTVRALTATRPRRADNARRWDGT